MPRPMHRDGARVEQARHDMGKEEKFMMVSRGQQNIFWVVVKVG